MHFKKKGGGTDWGKGRMSVGFECFIECATTKRRSTDIKFRYQNLKLKSTFVHWSKSLLPLELATDDCCVIIDGQ